MGTAALPGYDGTSFAADGIVYVSVNYRLGSEGFSVLKDAPLNLGLPDVAAALQWVHAEIAAFRRRPGSHHPHGRARWAAVSSPRSWHATTPGPSSAGRSSSRRRWKRSRRTVAGKVTGALAKRLKVPATREGFARRRPDELVEARRQQSAGSSPRRTPGFHLALIRIHSPRSPHEVLAEIATPLLIGTNTDEYRLWFSPQALARISESCVC